MLLRYICPIYFLSCSSRLQRTCPMKPFEDSLLFSRDSWTSMLSEDNPSMDDSYEAKNTLSIMTLISSEELLLWLWRLNFLNYFTNPSSCGNLGTTKESDSIIGTDKSTIYWGDPFRACDLKIFSGKLLSKCFSSSCTIIRYGQSAADWLVALLARFD